MTECKRKENEKSCPCSHVECERHGICCECIRFHRERKEKPVCVR